MKYKYLNQVIPTEKREELNKKILYCIDNNLCEKFNITNEIIYNSYTGVGGLHGLDFKKFDSFHAYTKAKQEEENGQFYTHHNEGKKLIESLCIKDNELILDLTAGIGNLFNFCPVEKNCYGNELDMKSYKVSKKLYNQAVLTHGDMRTYRPNIKFDIVIGNPPFNIQLEYKHERKQSQMIYIEKSLDLLNNGGLMALIVPYSFLADEFSNKKDIQFMNDNFNFICQSELDKNAFKYLGVENFKTKIIVFSKKSEYITNNVYDPYTFVDVEKIASYVSDFRTQQEKNKGNIRLENMKNYTNNDKEFDDTVRKILFDIRRTKATNKYYNECFNYYQLYYNQEKPESINIDEWNKIRVTKKKVISKLKKVLSSQHNRRVIKSENPEKVMARKNKGYQLQSIPFNDMEINTNIDSWLRKFTLVNQYTDEKINLNNEQLTITNKMLQKKYGYIQSSQGTGKTIMSIYYSMYRKNNVVNTLVIAPSIAINGTWTETLESFNIPYRVVKSISDIEKITKGEFILLTFNMVCKLKRHMKKYLSRIGNKYTLLVDEADSICNITSKRTQATLSVGKKARYKLLLSGTMTRNNIVESYTQFNLLYGSSPNFINKCEYILKEDKDTKELAEKLNEYYNKPFPSHKKGLELFKQSFNPQKITVFGVGKNTQDIYNSIELKEIIDKTIITKTFEEVVGKKIYSIKQHTVKFNDAEEKLYYKAINEFYNMKYLFTSTGNPRKDRMMEIIQQINLMLNICKHPQTFKEYNSLETPSKYKKVLTLVNEWESEYVAIGCRSLKEIDCYSRLLRENTDRKIFVVTGSTSMIERKEIIKRLKDTKNGILLSTQQSLSSSISINFVNKVICTALSWNWGTMSQYYFRFIRYNSTDFKEVHFITYENSLESNLLSLIASKENLNNFMKNQDESEVEEELGIDFDLLSMLLTKEKDSEGRTYISWGSQTIA